MSKKFNLNSSADVRRLKRALESAASDLVTEAAEELAYDVECPHCHKTVRIATGKHPCPECGEPIVLNISVQL